LYPNGGILLGYTEGDIGVEDTVIYKAVVLGQHEKQIGGRSVFSSREKWLRLTYGTSGRYPKGVDTSKFFSKPDYFMFEVGDG